MKKMSTFYGYSQLPSPAVIQCACVLSSFIPEMKSKESIKS